MPFNYKLVIEYNGSNFAGSQIQNHNQANSSQRTVQAETEKAFTNYFQTPINTNFAGRTDAGVHAIGQVINFQTSQKLDVDTELKEGKVLLSLNSYLPEDISVTKIEEVNEDFHARFSANAREYMYKIFVRRFRPVLRLDSLAWVREPLDFQRMQEHAKTYIGTHDFSRFAKDDEDPDANYVCEVMESELIIESKICVKYRVKANRFLRHMVRRLVGELVEVAKGESPSEKTSNITMPAEGLTLMKVYY